MITPCCGAKLFVITTHFKNFEPFELQAGQAANVYYERPFPHF